MKRNKLLALFLSLALIFSLMAGCAPTVVVLQEAPAENKPAEETAPDETVEEAETPAEEAKEPAEGAVPVKTGLSFVTSTTSSKAVSEEGDGVAQTDIMLVAVTVDDNGVIDSCVIDAVQAMVGFNAEGVLTSDITAPILSKNELGPDYGMGAISPIGKEWNEQAAAFADYVVGLTVDEVNGIAVTEGGKAADEDLASSVTIHLGGFLAGVEDAVNNAVHMGAQKGDKLVLNTVTTAAKSTDATVEEAGLAQTYCTVAAMTLSGETITSCYIDAVQANVDFDASGAITSELSDNVASKNTLGEDYGMHVASSIGADWYTQAASFSAYVTGKTLTEVAGIAVTESGKAADEDLASSVTIGIGDFQALIAKAAQ